MLGAMMRWLFFGTLLLSLTACGDDDVGPSVDAGLDSGAPSDGGGDAGHDARTIVDREVGFDSRPSNPDCVAPPRPASSAFALRVEPAFPALAVAQPIQVLQRAGEYYVVEREGRVLAFTSADGSGARAFLDIGDAVRADGEGGLLAIAFHPEWEENGELFASYTTRIDGVFHSRISRFTREGDVVPAASEEVILEVRQPYTNHNGGWIGFDPTSASSELYISFGDGGDGGDPDGNGQNRNTLLGAILRIDVDPAEGEAPYAIPTDNPFAAGGRYPGEGAAEIFAWGLRNPWRVSFDRETGDLWAGDVGQGVVEEIDLIENGGNYGWNVREGDRCYAAAECSDEFVEPEAVYERGDGRSVTGGYVYRGNAIPTLTGVYLYADYASGRLFGLVPDPETGDPVHTRLLETGISPAGFGEDEAGELYLCDLGAGIYRIASDDTPPSDDFPALLSETGCMDAADPSRPGPALIPYAPTATLWSDGATKERWFAIPDETEITVDAEGDFVFPTGTVLVKQFRQAGRLVETRLYLLHPDGTWGGYTYVWNEAQDDATLTLGGARVQVNAETEWLVPTQGQCQQCHTGAAGRSLGLEMAQLDADFVYPGDGEIRVRANQLDTLVGVGLVSLGDTPPEIAALPAYDDETTPLADRARGYLHSNCSNCHRPDGPGRGDIDLRSTAPLADLGCDRAPQLGSLGLEDARVVSAGSAASSVLSLRMHVLGADRMPAVGSYVVDPDGTSLIDAWIDSLAGCAE